MAEITDLPELNLLDVYGLPDLADVEVKQTAPKLTSVNDDVKKMNVVIKKQKHSAPWYQPEQEYLFSSLEFDLNNMAVLDKFLNDNLPKDPSVRGEALKFVEDVLLGNARSFLSKVFNDGTKQQAFIIVFSN